MRWIKSIKKVCAAIVVVILAASSLQQVSAYVDNYIITDTIANTYVGRDEAKSLIQTLNFRDVPNTHEAKEAITRIGAMGIVTGDSGAFNPSSNMTNEQAIVAILNSTGQQSMAQQAALTLAAQNPLMRHWSLGYLQLATGMGLITADDLAVAFMVDQSLVPANAFRRNEPVTKEKVIQWAITAVDTYSKGVFTHPTVYSKIYEYSDWENITLAALPYMEIAVKTGMLQTSGTALNPQSPITKSEFAQIIRNMDNYYLTAMGYTKKSGTIGAIEDSQTTTTGKSSVSRKIYVRTSDGSVDLFQYEETASGQPLPSTKDAVVLSVDKNITGMYSLAEGDQIEYIVRESDKAIIYIQDLKHLQQQTIGGYFKRLDTANNTITLTNTRTDGKEYVFTLTKGLLTTENNTDYIVINGEKQPVTSMINGSVYTLRVNNFLVVDISFVGNDTLSAEIQGVVTENNVEMGYITIIDPKGVEYSKNYYEDELRVTKEQYYENGGGNSYVSEIFPNFRYNPNDTIITDLEPGDIVYLRLDPDDIATITAVSAVTNYTVRYGKVRQLQRDGENTRILLESENKQTEWLDITPEIFVSEDGYARTTDNLMAGDWVKALVNEAVIAPGQTIVAVKELIIEGSEHFVENIIKGQLAGINTTQGQLSVQNYQTLQKTGWSGYSQLAQIDITSKDISYFYNGKQISLSYASQYLKRNAADVYIATEKRFDKEVVSMVSFRTGRDELLPADTIASSDGNGRFTLMGSTDSIATDIGTIVRRHGRLVDPQNIMAVDYANISLNGENFAAVVDIYDAPNTDEIQVIRGRIQSIDEGKSFQVSSIAILSNNIWSYTPIQRVFTLDYNTRFYGPDGEVDMNTFVGYGDASKINNAYTIITDGTKATHIYEAPYTTNAVRGTIYNIDTETGSVSLKNCSVYNATTGVWTPAVSTVAMVVTISPNNGFAAKNNELVNLNKLAIGDQVRAMVTTIPDRVVNNTTLEGYIIFVEK